MSDDDDQFDDLPDEDPLVIDQDFRHWRYQLATLRVLYTGLAQLSKALGKQCETWDGSQMGATAVGDVIEATAAKIRDHLAAL